MAVPWIMDYIWDLVCIFDKNDVIQAKVWGFWIQILDSIYLSFEKCIFHAWGEWKTCECVIKKHETLWCVCVMSISQWNGQ